jgi:hypothetical protein
MEKYTAPPGEAWRLGEGPFVFSGVPPICSGELELVNESDEKVKVRAMPVVGLQHEAVAQLGLGEVRMAARLMPHDRTRARAFFLLDPGTPPDTYTAEILCADQREPVVIHVFENPGLQVSPGAIRLRGAGGDVQEALVVVGNRGNLTETVPELALVFLEERNWVGRSLVQALQETGDDERHQEYLDRVLHELKATVSRPARVTVKSGAGELRPGETRELKLEVALPSELIKGRIYFGSTRFMSAKLVFEVVCNGTTSSTKRRPR